MAKTIKSEIVAGIKHLKDTYRVETKTYFRIFQVSTKKLLNTETLGNDLVIYADEPINKIYFNGKKIWDKKENIPTEH